VDCELFFEHALLPAGWARDVHVRVRGGLIADVTTGAPGPSPRHGIALPGLCNVHSHTFQRAIAGLTELRAAARDDFWSWRHQMYRFGLTMSPDDIEAAAAQAFVEMLECGFTGVAEFHYLHHDIDGRPYADIAETTARIAAAAAAAGIDLLLLPVFYAHANFGGAAPLAEQRRFICSPDQFARLVERCRALAPTGIAPHSLRAVTAEELGRLVQLGAGAPFHLHIAEQTQEVADCLAWSGARPVEWLLANAPVAANWCLIHATHTDAAERRGMAQAGAVAGLCPVTEANLGDGIFALRDYDGAFGLGTDSNVLISAAQEIRQLEYAQRLDARRRNVLASTAHPATATAIYARAAAGGAQALGQPGGIAPGRRANIVTLDKAALGPAAANPETALATSVFAARAPMIDSVWVGGRQCVAHGRHLAAQPARARFDDMLTRLI
jgi:formimidoylglutamate deiminase